ncbi:PAS domain-containing protein [Flavobacterium sp. 5]|uniref:PAS domain-containing protein n=1 Tax=Flavobacterium sp. 5 TaxID=2035199 RepID=UPI000C2BEF2D|nr:PAS domain-containing protein [Flavobacterium sp. 5]PKB15652.1 phospho-acceptor domain-containing protein [Flavobacterium sp. 5]
MKYIRNKSSIYHKIIFTISLFILFFISVLTVKHIKNISNSTKLLMHTYEVNLELEHLYSNIKDSENDMRGYIISKDNIYLILYKIDIKNINKSFSIVKKLTKNNVNQQENLESLYKIVNKRSEHIAKYSNLDKNIDFLKNYDFKKNFKESSNLLIDIRIKLNDMVHNEQSNLTLQNSLYDKQIYFTPIITLGILFTTLLLLIFTYYKTTKDIDKVQAANVKLNKSQFLSYQAEIISEFGTWEWNFNSSEIIYSDNLYRILGVEPKSFEANQDNFMKFVHPEDVEIVNTIFENIIVDENLQHTHFRIIRPDNTIRMLRSVGKLFTDNLGNKTILGVTNDITDEHAKNELLKSNYDDLLKVNNQLKIFDESSKQSEILGKYGSWILNFNTLKINYSDNRYRLLGYEPQEFEPSIDNLFSYVHPEDKKTVDKAFKKAMISMELPSINYRVITKDGRIRNFRTIAKSYIDLSGTQNMIGTTRDVTEDYNKSLQLKQRNIELQKHVKELNDFNQVASHDLQEPLRKIQTFISRINEKEKENITDIGKEYLSRMEIASERMRVLINDLLQYSKANRSENNLVKTNLNETLRDSLAELSQNIEDKKAVINYTELPTINAIPFQMQQLFSNLLSNSLKYSKTNTVPIISIDYSEITAKTEVVLNDKSTKKYYKINFTDNGIGFEQEFSKKIFLLFNRLHGKTEYHGTGVGLAICEKIVENHKGLIFANSKPNEGAIFTIYFPVPIS